MSALIDQSLYSRMILSAGNSEVKFFAAVLGDIKTVIHPREKMTRTDTNMWMSSQLVSGQTFSVYGIRFKETEVDATKRMFLLQHAHFVVQISDQDFLMYPLHLMTNYFFFLDKRLTSAILIPQHHYFHVILYCDRPVPYDIQLTCELVGTMLRPD